MTNTNSFKSGKQGQMPDCIFTFYAKRIDKTIKQAKQKQFYYTNKFKQPQDNPKTTWKLTNKIISNKSSQNNSLLKLKISTAITEDKHQGVDVCVLCVCLFVIWCDFDNVK